MLCELYCWSHLCGFLQAKSGGGSTSLHIPHRSMASTIVSMQFMVANRPIQPMLSRGRGGLAICSRRHITLLQTGSRKRLVSFTIRAGVRKKIRKAFEEVGVTFQTGFGFRDTTFSGWTASLTLGLVVLESLFLLAWAASLRGMLPGSCLVFTAAVDTVGLIMKLNFGIGLYSLMRSYSSLFALPFELSHRLNLKQPGVFDMVLSTFLSFFPFVNVSLWLRFASKQKRLETKAGIVANALIYEAPKLFSLLLIFSGWFDVFQQVFLLCNTATICGALHRVIDEGRVRNENVLADVARVTKKALKEMEVSAKEREISAEQQERIDRLRQLEEFDTLLALTPSRAKSAKVQDWTVGETMEWLGQQGLARYATAFAENSIDGELLLELTNNQLRDDLKILSFGDRKRLCSLIHQLREIMM